MRKGDLLMEQHFCPVTIKNDRNHEIPVIISIPHSGLYVPDEVKNKLNEGIKLPNMDWYLPAFYAFLEELGYTVVINRVSRYVIDVNRGENERCGSYQTNLVYTTTTQGEEMYRIPLTAKETEERIKNYYAPYHNALIGAIREKLKRYTRIYLLDLHSFGLDCEADIILGNDFGKTCSNGIISFLKDKFGENGFLPVENIPFSGAYITKNYCRQFPCCETVQIELSYRAYIQNRVFESGEENPVIEQEYFKNQQKKMAAVYSRFREYLR